MEEKLEGVYFAFNDYESAASHVLNVAIPHFLRRATPRDFSPAIEAEVLFMFGVQLGGVTRLELMGGASSSLGDEYLNVDLQAKEGIRGSVDDLPRFIEAGSIVEVFVTNPQYVFLKSAAHVLKGGGRIIVSGTVANKYFKHAGQPSKLGEAGLELVDDKAGPLDERLQDQRFYFSDLETEIPIEKMKTTIVLKRE